MAEFWNTPENPFLEARRSCQQVSCYRSHVHDRFSVGLIDAGSTQFTGAAGATAQLLPGDVIVIPAGHVHACNPEAGTWEYQMIHAEHVWATELLGEDRSPLFENVRIIRDAQLHDRISAFIAALFDGLDLAQCQHRFRTILQELQDSPPHQVIGSEARANHEVWMQEVLEILSSAEANPDLTELAAVAGVSKYHLIRSVKRRTGLAPIAWRQNSRINAARQLLRSGASVADTAATLGYADQSHFHRAFRAHVAATPGAYGK